MGEHLVDIEGVASSILAAPTIFEDEIEADKTMKVRNSIRSLKNRHRDCRVVRRKGRIYVINKVQKRFKARQG